MKTKSDPTSPTQPPSAGGAGRGAYAKLNAALSFYLTEIQFMREHGWTEAAYIERYGTTENPTLGDGGPLIWEADLGALFRARDYFLSVMQAVGVRGWLLWLKRNKAADALWKDKHLGLPEEINQIHAMRCFTRGLAESMRHSST